ncbi:hypothetical protein E8E14_014865 [Neopestalotiopsis sp. 37M]|nr:hypothetical protein E8E14_014865 [Neopestalotiopsis sp. 37M]
MTPQSSAMHSKDTRAATSYSVKYARIGIRWTICGYDAIAHWERVPSVESIIGVLKESLGSDEEYQVKHIWDGPYNKFYSVDCGDKGYMMKVTLPVCPRTKTESEVATIRWTAANTNLRGLLPEVIAYSSSANNPIGCEWILMKRLKGTPLSSCWRDVSLESKELIVKALAHYSEDVYKNRFKQIGNIYPAPLPGRGRRYQVGKIASMRFFWDKGAELEPNQGPFPSSKEWFQRRLNLAAEHLWLRFPAIQHGPQKERERIWRLIHMSGVGSRLWQLHDRLFPAHDDGDTDEDGHAVQAIGLPVLVGESGDFALQDGSSEQSEGDERETLQDHGPGELSKGTTAVMSPWTGRLGATNLDSVFSRTSSVLAPTQVIDKHEVKRTSVTQKQAQPQVTTRDNFHEWAPPRPNADEEIRKDLGTRQDVEPTMLWHDNLSADNILVDVETGQLTGILDWDCVSCLPVPIACDMPALLYDGKYRPEEPQVEDYAVRIPGDDDDPGEELGESRARQATTKSGGSNNKSSTPAVLSVTTAAQTKKRGRMGLQQNYWRALHEYELTHLRKVFMDEMVDRCPSWYQTWKRTKVYKDYEAAVQNCDNEHLIHHVEEWCDAVDATLAGGQEVKPPQVPHLHHVLCQGHDWEGWDDLDETMDERMRPIREQQQKTQQWKDDLDELDLAKKALSTAKGTKTRFQREKARLEKTIETAQQSAKKAAQDFDSLDKLDEQGLDMDELTNLRREARDRLATAQREMHRTRQKLPAAAARATDAEGKWEAARARELAAMERIYSSEWFTSYDRARTLTHETWKNLERALHKEYGAGATWWKHRLEPLGWCPRKKDRDAGLLVSSDESCDGGEVREAVADESEVSEEE